MNGDLPTSPESNLPVEAIQAELSRASSTRSRRVFEKFLMAAIGSIPWVGGFLSAAASIPGDEKAIRGDNLRSEWLQEHERKLRQLRETLDEVSDRFEKLGPAIDEYPGPRIPRACSSGIQNVGQGRDGRQAATRCKPADKRGGHEDLL